MRDPHPANGTSIEIRGLTKTFGAVRAVDDLTFDVAPGRVTGFLGPNGSGKTTTLRMLLGLVRPDSGVALVGGRPYVEHPNPGRVVGASLEANFHPGRTARAHLRTLAPHLGVGDARIDEVIGQVGLADAAERKVGGFSLGMRQRLALAGTLLADPGVLVLDEPANGLDPAGIIWLRDLLRFLAGQGRTVLVSSHVLAEVQASVDDVVVIANGRLVHASSLTEMVHLSDSHVRVSGPDPAALGAAAERLGWRVERANDVLRVRGASAAEVGAAAFAAGLELHELTAVEANLEQTFFEFVARGEQDAGQPGDKGNNNGEAAA
ncbi:ATP-binding cassette domain-containing protein [Nocardioides sp. Y6]|uniref:ATP-binding cassette domain-containing protein n=1 Tax=Nocardioides malaquae TaxID=2773426 RepID=A0ABR9RQA4_9ACTN|nr:ATP-binding cassette domain-containing protein [Nocardioides malaquae]MBE7323738.1 ATP-binding cassette domain-containing protein [Nocardioides malaquae]